ncbi:MAG: hypothetical protein ACK4YQ_01540 [Phenylobacterium sp.]|uniref:hypothetical protein n=1 Tax=Phenylobacterium sp. TaxID=1871053 RepID=UPI00391D43A3
MSAGLARRAADGLNLAAAPVLAGMGAASAAFGGATDMLCAAAPAAPLNGMSMMYLLMAAFHMGPWLRLAAGRDPARR